MRPMSQRQVAKSLKISRTHVQNIERSALNKIRVANGLEPLPAIGSAKYSGATTCRNCDEPGHNSRTCPKPRIPTCSKDYRHARYLRTGK